MNKGDGLLVKSGKTRGWLAGLLLFGGLTFPAICGATLHATLEMTDESGGTTVFTEFVDIEAFFDNGNAAVGDTGVIGLDRSLWFNLPTLGCDPAAFSQFQQLVSNRLLFIPRGTCTFATKIQNAEAAGAIGVLIINDSPELTSGGILLEPTGIPAALISGNAFFNSIQATFISTLRLEITRDVPEPAPLALLAIGLAGLGFSRRKRTVK